MTTGYTTSAAMLPESGQIDPGDGSHIDHHATLHEKINALTRTIFRGNGSPERVVAAGYNALYEDAAVGSVGVRLWVKNSADGMTGWIPLAGSTGTRKVIEWDESGKVTVGSFPTGWGPMSGQPGRIGVRRDNNIVTIFLSNFGTTADVGDSQLWTAPKGFVPMHPDATSTLIPWFNSSNAPKMFALRDSLQRIDSLVSSPGDYCRQGKISYLTTDEWPDSLPGEAW